MNQVQTIPHSDEAERSVLGAVFIDNAALGAVTASLSAADFYREPHKLLLRTFGRLAEQGVAIDTMTVIHALEEYGDLDRIGGAQWVARISHCTPTAANVGHHIRLVARESARRRTIQMAREVEQAAREGGDALETIAPTARELARLTQPEANARALSCGDAIQEALRDFADRKSGKVVGMDSPWPDLTKKTGVIRRGHLTVIAARPAMGKSALALQWCAHLLSQGTPCLYLSMEMPVVENINRLAAQVSGAHIGRVTATPPSFASEDEMQRYVQALHTISGWPGRWIDQRLSVHELRQRVEREVAEHGVRAVFVDYLQLLKRPQGMSPYDSVSEISLELKGMAGDLGVNVVAVAQLNRGVEQRADKRPLSSDLRDSGQIEQDANQVIMLYRDEVYDPESPDKGTAEVLVRKARGGTTGVVRLKSDLTRMRFSPLEERWS